MKKIKIEELIKGEIERDIDNLNDNEETELINNLYEDSYLVEERIESIISEIEEENEIEYSGDTTELIDYYVDRLTLYTD